MDKKGSALIMVYAFILILISLSAIIAGQSISENSQVKVFVDSMRVFWVAEAGSQRGFWELNYGSGAGTYQGTETGIGDYDVSMVNTGVGYYTITAIGSVPNRNSSNRIVRRISIDVVQVYIPIFRFAAFGKQSISMTNSATINSYDSDLGDYGGTNIGSNGNVGTNGTTNGVITLSNSSRINGDANTGSGGTINLINSSSISGTQSHTSNEAYPQVAVPLELVSLSSGGGLSLTNSATGTLSGGDYQYTSISLSNSAQLTITGNARIYLTSSATAFSVSNSAQFKIQSGASVTIYSQGKTTVSNSGSINNLGKKPADFILYSSYSGSNGVDISNSGSFYGSIYAPATSVSFSNSAEVYGSVIGNTISLPNSAKIHYDLAMSRLMSASVPSGRYSIQTWNEN